MNGKEVKYTLGLVPMLLWALILPGQNHLPDYREVDNKFYQVSKTSDETRKKYSWKARTEATRDNKVMQVIVEEFSYRSDGRQIRKVISDQQAPLPSIPLIRQVAEDQKAKIVTFMNGLRAHLEKYALTDDSIRHAFFSAAKISVPDTQGHFLVSGSDVLTKGDKLNWWFDTRTYSMIKATISTTFEGTSTEFSAFYNLLPGFNYMSQALIVIHSKNIAVKLTFFDFVKQ